MATENDKVNTGALGTLVAVSLFAVLSIALAVTALVRHSVQDVVDSRQSFALQGYHDLRAAQTAKLNANPSWTDKGKGLVSIPIERAEVNVLRDLARDPTSATPPAPPSATPAASVEAPAPAPTAANGKAPAPTGAVAPNKPNVPSAPKPTDG